MGRIPKASEVLQNVEEKGKNAALVEIIEVTATVEKMRDRCANVAVLTKYADLTEEMKTELLESGFKFSRAIVVNARGEIEEGFAILAIPS